MHSDVSNGTQETQPGDKRNDNGDTNALPKVYAAHFKGEGCLVEQVYRVGARRSRFELLQESKPDQVITVDHVLDSEAGQDLWPLDDDLIHKGYLRLPERSIPYGTTDQLLRAIRAHFDRYVVFPADMRLLIPHYVLYTWLYDRFPTAPMLRFLGDMGNGKSRAVQVTGDLCYHAFTASGGATMAAVFRSLEATGGGTLVMDELDFSTNRDEHHEMMRLLRNGFQKQGGGILRAEDTGNGYRAKAFDVFGPKILAGRKPFPDPALESRCFRVYMSPDVDLSGVPRELPPEHSYHAEANVLRNKLLRWRYDNYFKPLREPEHLAVEPRVFQLYWPLAAVTDASEAQTQLQDCILALNDEMTEDRGSSAEARVARALLRIGGDGEKRVLLSTVVAHVNGGNGAEVPNKDVSAICKSFGFDMKREGRGMAVLIHPGRLGRILTRYGWSSAPEGQEEVVATV